MKELVQRKLWEDFLKEASIVMQKYGSDLNMQDPANSWGGCFTCLPHTVKYYHIEQLLRQEK